MFTRILALCAVVAVLASLPGCGEDRVVIVREGGGPTGVVQGAIDPGDTSFELVAGQAQGRDGWFPGPFVIRGENIHYDDGIGALMVDLTVTNQSTNTYPLPVRLEFVTLLPNGVRVLNPDNGVHGPGAMIEFHFVNRDLTWDPGEVSLPRNVQFGVRPGVSIGFGARIHVGPSPDLGRISGEVWDDVDRDGVRDPNEFGLAMRQLTLSHADSTVDCLFTDCVIVDHTVTDIVGEYSFENLEAGYYVVSLVRDRCSDPTTPVDVQVILVEEDGEVSDIFDVDFGVSLIRNCCGLVNGGFSEGEFGWNNNSQGNGVGAGVQQIVSVDGRDDVLRLDSRAGSDYRLNRTQLTGSCGVLNYALSWDWKLGVLESPYGLSSVMVEFIDGAHGVLGRYFVHRHSGDFDDYACGPFVRRYLQDNPFSFVGCEEITATFAEWGTHGIVFTPEFFDGMQGVDVNVEAIAEINVWVESYNNAGFGVDAYFDNVKYAPWEPFE